MLRWEVHFPLFSQVTNIIVIATCIHTNYFAVESGKVYTCGYGNIHGKEGLLEVCSHLQPFSCEIKFKNIFALNHFFLATCSNNDIYMWGQLSSSSTGSILPRKLSLPGDLVEKRIFPGWSSVFIGTCH